MERKQTVKIDRPGINSFEIMDVPAAFDPDTATVEIQEVKPEAGAELMQIVVRRPDRKYIEDYINRERSASDRIISESVDLRSEIRDEILKICESAYHRKYEDMTGELVVLIDAKQACELELIISYFINDDRIFWTPALQVDMEDEDNNQAKLTGYINVENHTSFSFENVEFLFAEFERPSGPPSETPPGPPGGPPAAPGAAPPEEMSQMRSQMLGELKRLRSVIK